MTKSRGMIVAGVLLLSAFTTVQADETNPVVGKNGEVEITPPQGWEERKMTGTVGQLEVANAGKNAYCLVISESKDDFNHKSIQEYAETILKIEEKKSALADRTVSVPKALKINGAYDVQYEIHGTLKTLKLVYLKTFIESPGHWNQLSCWTTPSHWQDAQADFNALNDSFKEIKSAK